MEKIAIILPAYNEELTIADTIRDFHTQLNDATFVIVNNASTDKTASEARKTLLELSAKGLVIDEPRAGKGNAARRGFRAVDAEIYVIVDADMTYPAKHIHDLIQPVLENKADMVVGDRLSHGHYEKQNKRSFHSFGNSLVCWLVNKLFRANLVDIMSGYRALSRDFVMRYPILVEGFQIETDMTLHALDKRFRVVEIPVEYRDRPEGSVSKLSTFRDGARVILTITKIFRHYRPMLFFGSIALLLAVCSLLAGIPVIQDWIEFQYIYHVPLAILASALALLAALALALGLILDSIAYLHRMNYERDIQLENLSRPR
jgi:glycosyltransferase involved in cell wall biosynthesis